MKLVFIVFVFLYAFCISTAEEGEDILNQSIDIVLKYKYGQNSGDTDDDNCTKSCCRNPPNDIITVFTEVLSALDRNPMDLKKTIYDQDRLIRFCKYANSTADCVRQCPETQRRTFMKKIFAPAVFVCEDPCKFSCSCLIECGCKFEYDLDLDFIPSVPCYKAVYEEMRQNCTDLDSCGQRRIEYDESLTDYRHLDYDSHNITKHQEKVVASICKLLDCTLKCNSARRTEKCGEDADRSLNGFYAHLVKTATAIGARYNYTLPSVCNSLGT